MKSAYDKIAAGLNDALAYAAGDKSRGRLATPGAAAYPAIIERAGAGYSVFFPDLPGCTSAGDTIDEATRAAGEALRGHLAASAAHGDPIPTPSHLDSVARHADVDEVTRMMVRAAAPGS